MLGMFKKSTSDSNSSPRGKISRSANSSTNSIVTPVNEDEGSGDESASNAGSVNNDESEEFIKNGNKGIIVFTNIFCVKTDRYKTFHLHLNSGLLVQYSGRSRKKFLCGDIQGIKRNSNNQVVVKIKHSMDISSKTKKYCFDNDEAYHKFKAYVEYTNSNGAAIRAAFEEIDFKGLKVITKAHLLAALFQNDIDVSEAELSAM
jgi:hypothetical protein